MTDARLGGVHPSHDGDHAAEGIDRRHGDLRFLEVSIHLTPQGLFVGQHTRIIHRQHGRTQPARVAAFSGHENTAEKRAPFRLKRAHFPGGWRRTLGQVHGDWSRLRAQRRGVRWFGSRWTGNSGLVPRRWRRRGRRRGGRMHSQWIRGQIRANKRLRNGRKKRLRRPIPRFGRRAPKSRIITCGQTSTGPRSVHLPRRPSEMGVPQSARRRNCRMCGKGAERGREGVPTNRANANFSASQ